MKIYGNFVYILKHIAKKSTSYGKYTEPFGGMTTLQKWWRIP